MDNSRDVLQPPADPSSSGQNQPFLTEPRCSVCGDGGLYDNGICTFYGCECECHDPAHDLVAPVQRLDEVIAALILGAQSLVERQIAARFDAGAHRRRFCTECRKFEEDGHAASCPAGVVQRALYELSELVGPEFAVKFTTERRSCRAGNLKETDDGAAETSPRRSSDGRLIEAFEGLVDEVLAKHRVVVRTEGGNDAIFEMQGGAR